MTCPTCSGTGFAIEFRRYAGEAVAGEPYEVPCPEGCVPDEDEPPLCMGCDGVLDEDGWCDSCEEFAAVPAELLPENKDRWVA